MRVLIAGAGEAGVAAAAGLRGEGFRGQILLVNGEPDPPYGRPPLSKDVLAGTLSQPAQLRAPAWYAEQDIQLLTGARVVTVDAAAGRADVRTCDRQVRQEPFDRLLVATGSRARTLPVPPGGPIFTLRSLSDLRALGPFWARAEHIIVVGGGVIGLEAAAVARASGRRVTVVEAAPSLMRRALPPPVGDVLAAHHRALGVDLRLDTTILDIEPDATGVHATLSNGERLTGDLVLVAVGVIPRTELAQMAGCELADGVLVDAEGRTTVEGVFAAGDVAAFPYGAPERRVRIESWQHAVRHGGHVGRIMAGARGPYLETPWFWTDQGDLNLQVVGLAADSDLTLWRGQGPSCTAIHFSGDRLVAATTLNNGRDIRPLTRLIAAGWRGEPAQLADETQSLSQIVKAAAGVANSTGESTSWAR